MNFPALAHRTYKRLKDNPIFNKITIEVIKGLRMLPDFRDRARFTHKVVTDLLNESFRNPVVKELVSCKKGCSFCCHTQVSVTEDEAKLLAEKVLKKEVKIITSEMYASMS